MSEFPLPDWPRAFGGPSGTGDIKTIPGDFFVEEILGFQPEGSGEHVFLFVEKIGENTEYVARLLARHAGVRQRDIGYAGLKDRHGRTRQCFSVWLPGKVEPDWRMLQGDHLKILEAVRHPRKLKRGVLQGNRFEILIRNWQGDRERLDAQLEQVKRLGFPNYFGEQRFGFQGRNVGRAAAMFGGVRVKAEQRSIYLSAARSYLFNLILAERVAIGSWSTGLTGEAFMLAGSHSYFAADEIDSALAARLAAGDIQCSGALWGKGVSGARADALELEQRIVAAQPILAQGLISAGLTQDRRALVVRPTDLVWGFESEAVLRLGFGLPAGAYATALLREIVALDESLGVVAT
ncbi:MULTISPECIES: tRNA pseudouridine(13) synthase TruD [Methylomonas]|uniref:tRNA pseudouridine synthase D n=1 Tax=Methylomonas koyamae TaxID=702114 RepID=A0A177NAX5_9GAMM|nr:tRNA pseudouridine(13) synthase TruD [Methylomonas koyamae]OAI14250.1 tRNA pseudouridine synthase TruD [Methylomonas koyamae]